MEKADTITNVGDLVSEIGRKNISGIGFREQDISRAISENIFPSGWYPYIRNLCISRKLDMPENLFRWSKVPNTAPQIKEAS